MKLTSSDSRRDTRHVVDATTRDRDPHTRAAPRELAQLALMLIVELGACLQMITGDIARATDLDEASTRWLARLIALVALIEQAAGKHALQSEIPDRASQTPATNLPPTTSSAHMRTRPQAQRQHTPGPGHNNHSRNRVTSTSPARSYPRSLRLTEREREIVVFTQKGYTPRKIARRLQISVETVYTHLRNARRKQRLLDSLQPL